MKNLAILSAFLFFSVTVFAQSAQSAASGLVIGSILDADNSKALEGAGLKMLLLSDTANPYNQLSQKNGEFLFNKLAFGYYRLQITAVGYNTMIIDSIYLRAERFDFDLNDIKLSKHSKIMNEVIVYAEKPLIEKLGLQPHAG